MNPTAKMTVNRVLWDEETATMRRFTFVVEIDLDRLPTTLLQRAKTKKATALNRAFKISNKETTK